MKNKDKERQEHQSTQSQNPPDQSEVARRAYELYESRGGESGHDLEDWLQAEREINEHRHAVHSA